jgi:O-acetyl-ADP-ribose deacetylase (regulator of RNase III)
VIQFQSKDILSVTDGVICHQVNCLGVMGAGLARAISVKWPQVKTEYLKLLKGNGEDLTKLLGRCQVIPVGENLMVANLFGQLNYGRYSVQTNYVKLEDAFHQLRNFSIENKKDVYIPYMIGCGLAGGNWDTVFGIVYKIFNNLKQNIYICKIQ